MRLLAQPPYASFHSPVSVPVRPAWSTQHMVDQVLRRWPRVYIPVSAAFLRIFQPIAHDITADGAHHTTLRDTAVGGIERPILQISRFEQSAHQPEEAVVVEGFAEETQQHRMIDGVEGFDNSIPPSTTHSMTIQRS